VTPWLADAIGETPFASQFEAIRPLAFKNCISTSQGAGGAEEVQQEIYGIPVVVASVSRGPVHIRPTCRDYHTATVA
jgi:hypothetical protein